MKIPPEDNPQGCICIPHLSSSGPCQPDNVAAYSLWRESTLHMQSRVQVLYSTVPAVHPELLMIPCDTKTKTCEITKELILSQRDPRRSVDTIASIGSGVYGG